MIMRMLLVIYNVGSYENIHIQYDYNMVFAITFLANPTSGVGRVMLVRGQVVRVTGVNKKIIIILNHNLQTILNNFFINGNILHVSLNIFFALNLLKLGCRNSEIKKKNTGHLTPWVPKYGNYRLSVVFAWVPKYGNYRPQGVKGLIERCPHLTEVTWK
jgi:hypothetical protein